jgi:hypothetical protein
MMSGGAVTLASDGDYDVTVARDLEERMRDSLRPLEEQLRALTDEHRTGSMPSIGQRLVQLEHEMQSLRGAMTLCAMWETTFPRNSHAGWGKYFTKMRAYSPVC